MSNPKEIGNEILKRVYKKRSKKDHKGDYGRLLVIGGSEKYTGAPVFNSHAAINAMAGYRSGVDLVSVIAVKRAADTVANISPNIITIPLRGKRLNKKHLKKVLGESKEKDAFVIGGGLGNSLETKETVREFLRKVEIPGVIDADAIHSLEEDQGKSIDLSNCLLTPHSHEFSILSRRKPTQKHHIDTLSVKKAAKKLETTILLKGHRDIISNGKEISINKTGNPYMTVGGTGDTLAGIAGSLIAQGNSLFDSACASSYINGKAAENTGRKRSFVTSDLLEEISKIVDSIN